MAISESSTDILDNIREPLRAQLDVFTNGTENIEEKAGVKSLSTSDRLSEVICRARDLCLSVIALMQLSLLMLVISLAILKSSGKPIFFRQKRMGKAGKLFTIYKFRTMVNNAEEILRSNRNLYSKYVENDYKLDPEDDPRVTRLGHFLRRSSLDELPQVLNVLKGDMSLVGPRPIVPEEIERYDGYGREFLSVKPGITGLWQVMGRSEIAYPERKYLDMIYIRNRSVYMDTKIMLKTIRVVCSRKGAH